MSDLLAPCIAPFLLGGPVIAAGCDDGHVCAFAAYSGAVLFREPLNGGSIGSVAYSPDGKTMAVGCADGYIRLLDSHSGRVFRKLLVRAGEFLRVVRYSPTGETLVAGCGGAVRAFRVPSGSDLFQVQLDPFMPVLSLAYDPSGQQLAAGCGNGRVYTIAADTGKKINDTYTNETGVEVVTFPPGSQSLVAMCKDGELYSREASSNGDFELRQVDLQHDMDVTPRVDFAPNGRTIAIGLGSNGVCVLDASSSAEALPRVWSAGKVGTVEAVAYAPNGNSLAAGCADGCVLVLGSDTGSQLSHVRLAGEAQIRAVAYAPVPPRCLK